MSDEKIYLFTTTRCPKCPMAKEFVKESGLEEKVEIVVADTSVDAMALAEGFEINFVPTFVVVKDDTHQNLSLDEFKKWLA